MFSFFLLIRPPQRSTLFPYTTLFRSAQSMANTTGGVPQATRSNSAGRQTPPSRARRQSISGISARHAFSTASRSEEHTSELQSRQYLVCRLLLEKKKQKEHRNNIRRE